MAQKWTEELTPDMLPDGLCRVIAEEIGTDNLLKLSVLLGGSSFYLPRRERILRPLRDRKILEEFAERFRKNAVTLVNYADVMEDFIQSLYC